MNAAKVHGIKYITLLSLVGCFKPPTDIFLSYKEIEEVAENASIPFTFFRSEFPFEHLYFQIPALACEEIVFPLGTNTWAPISIENLSEIMCRVMLNPREYWNKCYDIAGPEMINGVEIGDAFGDVLEGKIMYRSVRGVEYKGIHSLVD
jgi:uncharacterized protein YbjT (DUF2867 family)